jgi:hypothetical protein
MADEFGILPPELDYLREEPIQKEILDVWEDRVIIMPGEVDSKTLTFKIPETNHYTALYNSYFMVSCKVTGPKGVPCDHSKTTDPDKVCIVNNFAQSLWKNVKVTVNSEVVEDTQGLHAFRGYLEALLNHNSKVLEKRGSLIGWAKDTSNKLDKTVKGGGNTGMDNRTKPFMNSAEVTMVAKLSCDMFEENVLIPPDWTVLLDLERSSNEFALIAAGETIPYEVHITNLTFFVQRVKVRDELIVAHKRLFASLPGNKLHYPARRIGMHRFVVSPDAPTTRLKVIESKTLPDRIVFACLAKNSIEGRYDINSFNFLHKNICKVHLDVTSGAVPRYAYEPDFTKPNGYIREYYNMLAAVGAHEGNTTVTLTAEEYAHGFTVFAFCLAPRLGHGAVLSEQRIGSVTIDLTFKQANQESFEVVVLAETRSPLVFNGALKK